MEDAPTGPPSGSAASASDASLPLVAADRTTELQLPTTRAALKRYIRVCLLFYHLILDIDVRVFISVHVHFYS